MTESSRFTLNRIHPTKNHPPQLPLHTLPHLHDAPIGSNIHTLPHSAQPLHIALLIAPTQLLQLVEGHPHAPARLAHDVHLAQHGFVVEILQGDPQAARRDIVLGDHMAIAVVGIGGREDGRQGRGQRRRGPAGGDVADVAGPLQAEQQMVQLVGARERRQPQARHRGILQVGAGVGEENEGHCCFVRALEQVRPPPTQRQVSASSRRDEKWIDFCLISPVLPIDRESD